MNATYQIIKREHLKNDLVKTVKVNLCFKTNEDSV